MTEPTRDELAEQYATALSVITELRGERDAARRPLARLIKWVNDRALEPIDDPDRAVDRAIFLLPDACGDDHHVGGRPDDCFACLASVTTADLDWLHKLVNIRVGKVREYGNRNSWTCERCKVALWTVDVDEGVTPMIIACRVDGCGGEAVSACYRVGGPGAAPPATHRWVRPRSLARLEPGDRQHVEAGGLILEEIPETERASVDELLETASRQEGADVR